MPNLKFLNSWVLNLMLVGAHRILFDLIWFDLKFLYRKGNEYFVSEDYDRAVELYADALAHDPSVTECYAASAQAYIKMERFQDAKKMADR